MFTSFSCTGTHDVQGNKHPVYFVHRLYKTTLTLNWIGTALSGWKYRYSIINRHLSQGGQRSRWTPHSEISPPPPTDHIKGLHSDLESRVYSCYSPAPVRQPMSVNTRCLYKHELCSVAAAPTDIHMVPVRKCLAARLITPQRNQTLIGGKQTWGWGHYTAELEHTGPCKWIG